MQDVVLWIASELLSYGVLSWLTFVAISFCAGRYGAWWYVPLGQLAVTAVIVFLDIDWIQSEMASPGWNGVPDMDILFCLGVLLRIVIVNAVLLPVTFIGMRLRPRCATESDCGAARETQP